MKIGVTTSNYFMYSGAEKGFALMKRDGWEVCDYSSISETASPLFELTDSEFERHMLKDAEAARNAGIEIYQTHGPWRWPPRDGTAEERAERFEKMSKDLHATKLLGAKYMVIHPIMPWGWGKPPCEQEYMDLNLEYYSRLTKVAEQEDVVIALENMPMPELPLGSPKQIIDFVKQIESPYLRVCLDTGHAAVITQNPTPVALRAAEGVQVTGKEYLRCLHIHDNDGVRDCHWLPYFGVTDFNAFAKALKEIEYDGPITLECGVGGNEFMPDALKEQYMKTLAATARLLANA